MNQQKIGEFLKCLRKEIGLTQEQLAERFSVSSRTVSRWETGSNMPDVGMLVELADFYDADIREIIDGERKSEMMDKETKETFLKVAEYASEGEKLNQSAVLYTALGVSITLCICTLLFSSKATGLLNGIIPDHVCYYIMAAVYGLAFLLLLFYIRVRPFCEKPSLEPKKAIVATVISKEVRRGTNRSGRSTMGYSFVINFKATNGQTLEIYAYEIEYGGLKVGMKGALTYQGRYFVSFDEHK